MSDREYGASSSPAAGPLVLVVDDNQDAADTLAMVLQLNGLRAEAVYSASDALGVVRDRCPHAILLDLALPGVSGLDLARRLRTECDPQPLLVAVTGWGR